MDVWMREVVARFKNLLGRKKAATEACKAFDESKVEISKEFEEKKDALKPKVMEIYEASSAEIKALIKEPNAHGLKKHSHKVEKFLEELTKIEFPGSKAVYEATSKYGAGSVSGPVTFVFEKVCTFIVTVPEEKTTTTTREVEVEVPAPAAAAAATTTVTEVVAKEVVVEKAAVAEPEKVAAPAPATKEAPAKVEGQKTEDSAKAK